MTPALAALLAHLPADGTVHAIVDVAEALNLHPIQIGVAARAGHAHGLRLIKKNKRRLIYRERT